MRMVVVLPAPFGPRKPRISPFSTLNEMPSTAVWRPYLLVRFSTSIIDLPSRRRAATSLKVSKAPGVCTRRLVQPCVLVHHLSGVMRIAGSRTAL